MTALAGDGSRSPLSDRGRRTRERLVVAARTVFEERGFDATRMSDIALAAGVSHGTVYTWFPTKEDVLHAAVDSVTEEMYEVLSTPEVTDPIERIAVANARYLTVHRQTARLMEVVAQAAVNDASFRAVLTGLRRTHVDRVAKTIERLQAEGHAVADLDPRISAAALCAMVEGFARHWMGSDSESEEQMAPDARVLTTLTELWARSLGLIESGGG
ncbi:MAG: TetR/AcrR family transcriptional regulator [Actinobacteria bacterium]|nr:TetR/AcrR family transcriptional regulator [Actinomycetota bacterium]